MNKAKGLGFAVLCVALGFAIGWAVFHDRDVQAIHRIIAMSWGDGATNNLKAFYGAEVYVEPSASQYAVRARVWIGRGNPMTHDCGELGKVNTPEEAVAQWGQITWTPTDLVIGPGKTGPFKLPRSQLEAHR